MAVSSPSTTNVTSASNGNNNYTPALVVLTSLFFMWGFITCLNDILIPHLQNVFSLSYFESMLIQFCFFFAYFVVSLPSGKLVEKIGYKKGIVIGLVTSRNRNIIILSCRRYSFLSIISFCFLYYGIRHYTSSGCCKSLRSNSW